VRILLDEMLPADVAGLLPEHEVVTVQQAGFKGLKNGVLLRRAVADGFVVLLTADRNLPAQQNIAAGGIAVVLVRGSRMQDVSGQVDGIRSALASASPGTVTRVKLA
jgi:predicted nuclease of predicted toxin-antitoxin system